MDCDPKFAGACSSNETHLLTQGGPNDIVHDLNLSKQQAEILGSRSNSWTLLRQDTKVSFFFTVGTMKNSKISSPWKVVSCFAMIFVPLWKFLAMNVTQISGACSMISQKWAWRWFYSSTEIDFPPFVWLMQPTLRKIMKAWSYSWERLSMANLSGCYVVISRLWHCYSECNSSTQNTAVSCASGTIGTRRIAI